MRAFQSWLWYRERAWDGNQSQSMKKRRGLGHQAFLAIATPLSREQLVSRPEINTIFGQTHSLLLDCPDPVYCVIPIAPTSSSKRAFLNASPGG